MPGKRRVVSRCKKGVLGYITHLSGSVINTLANRLKEGGEFTWSVVHGYIHHSEESTKAGAWGNFFHHIYNQETEKDELCSSVRFLLFTLSRTPAYTMGPPTVKVDLSTQPDLGKFSQACQPCLLGNPYNLSRWKSVLTITRTNMKQPCLCVKKPLFSKLIKEIIWWKSSNRPKRNSESGPLESVGMEVRRHACLPCCLLLTRVSGNTCLLVTLKLYRGRDQRPHHLSISPGYVLHTLPEQVTCLHSLLRGHLTYLCPPPHLSKLRSPLVTLLSKLPVPYPLKLGVEIQSISNLLSSHLKINNSTYHVPGSG